MQRKCEADSYGQGYIERFWKLLCRISFVSEVVEAVGVSRSKADLERIQDTLNRRPRPTSNLDTPADRLAALLNQAA